MWLQERAPIGACVTVPREGAVTSARRWKNIAMLVGPLVIEMALAGCSIRRTAVEIVGDASVYESDDDPQLIQDALPFGLKTYESLLAVSPDHMGLLLATAKGFVSYAYLLKLDADRLD